MFAFSFPLWDKELFIFLNSLHAPWLDPVMLALSSAKFWIPFYIILAGVMVYKKKWLGLFGILFIFLGFGLADQLSVHLFKNVFQRLRPCHELDIQAIMHSLEACGGKYGFVSNHAANTFSLAIFIALFFRKKYFSIFIFLWAAAISYSRIYVGKHYPLDIICGAVFGICCGLFAYWLYRIVANIYSKKTGKS